MNAQLPHPEQKTPPLDPANSSPKARQIAARSSSPMPDSQSLWLKRGEQIAFSSLWIFVIAGCAWYFISDRGFDTIDIDQQTPTRVEFRVDINSASAFEFSCLPRIGSKTANRIVEWRSENGPFKSIESLTNVPGITPKMFDSLAQWLDCQPSSNSPISRKRPSLDMVGGLLDSEAESIKAE